jgi:sugar O-acyltransferase (sialic acid O-acetyltransferase NeuD family)
MSDGPEAPYVMFGHNPLFGDFLDIIHARGGMLKKVVVNVPDPAPPGSRTFRDRLEDANRRLESAGGTRIAVEEIEQFRPHGDERYVIGFRGEQLVPLRDRLQEEFAIAFDSLIHPSAVLAPSVVCGEGIIVNAGSVVASGVTLGDFCFVNRAASVGHDARLMPFANIGPGAHVASGVTVGRAAVVGIGATVIENLTIGDRAFVAAGAVVIRDVEPGSMVAGVPATCRGRREGLGQP